MFFLFFFFPGPIIFQVGYHPRKRTFKTQTLNTYFPGMKIDAFLHPAFLIFCYVFPKICQTDGMMGYVLTWQI